MFSLNEGNRYVVCLQGVDLRKGVNGLCGLIRQLSLSPINGDCICISEQNSHHHEIAPLGTWWFRNFLQALGKWTY